MNNRALEKIKKCLRLAQSDNPNEAAAGLRQAQKLMEKHGLTHSDLQLSEVQSQRVKSGSAKNPPVWIWKLMHTIASAFAVEHYNYSERSAETGYRWQCSAQFIGIGSAPEVASYAFSVLVRQLRKDRQSFLTSLPRYRSKSDKTRQADLFAEAWVEAVQEKIVAMAMKPEEKTLVKRWKEREYSDDEIIKQKCRSHHRMFDSDDAQAIREGVEAGSKVDLYHGVGASAAPAMLEQSHTGV